MNKTAKFFSLLLALLMVVSMLAGCGATTPAPAPGGDTPATPSTAAAAKGIYGDSSETYYQINFVSGVEYWFPVYAAFKQAGNRLGVQTFYMGPTEYDANKEVEVFNQVLAQNPTGIFLSPITAEAFKEPIDRAIDQGVAVITFASDSPESKRNGYITSDNVQEGTYAAHKIAEQLGGKGAVMTLCNPGQTNHDIRIDTFRAVIASEYPGIKLLSNSPTNQDPDKAYAAVMTEAQKNPDLGAVFMPEASSAMGAARAAVELGTGIKVLCCDVNTTILDMIKAGEVWGAINPDQGMQGYFGMLMLFMAAHPEMIETMSYKKGEGLNPTYIPFVDNGLDIVTADIADYYYIDKYCAKLGFKNVDEMLAPGKP